MKKRGYVINYILLLVCILTSLNHVESYKTMVGQVSYFDAQSKAELTYVTSITTQEHGKEPLTTTLQAEAHAVANSMGVLSRDNAASVDYAAATASNSRADYLKTIGYITSADACTAEMLESARSNLLNRASVVRQNEIREKDGAPSESLKTEGALQNSNQFYTFANLCAKIIGTDTAGVIRFIHNKDGKKEI